MDNLKCPHCGQSEIKVLESNPSSTGGQARDLAPVMISRRRMCTKCNHRFSTYEITVDDYNNLVERARLAERFLRMINEVKLFWSISATDNSGNKEMSKHGERISKGYNGDE